MDKIIFQASRLRRVPCTIIEPPLEGGSHTVYKITFDDSVEWVVRTNKVKGNSEIDTRAAKKLRYIRKIKPDIKVPEVYIDGGIIFTEWMAGEPLRVWNFQIALARRHTFLDGLAEVLLQLWTTPTAEGSASGTTGLYSTWLITSLDRALRRTLLGTARWGDAIDYLIMRSMIPAYSDAVDQYSTLGFAHGDLNAHNLIRTENFQLAGVIDWDWMYEAPQPAIIHHPWFIADVPGWNNDGVSPGDEFSEDRAYLETSIAQKEALLQQPGTVSHLLRSSPSRFFFQSAFHFKGVHEKFVDKYCARSKENLGAAAEQLEAVMALYPELAEAGEQLRQRLPPS